MSELPGGGSVADTYQHVSKLMTPADGLRLPGAYLKWYDLRRAELELSTEERQQARDFLASTELPFDDELGFVILHKCTPTFSFLLVQTWRGENELWETVFAKNDDGPFQLHTFPGDHRGTFCVWEMGAVWHEAQAWSRYLASVRDDEARKAYVEDRFTGVV
ncbi:hypothetical protein [Streptomyces melanogenes]|uniref:hypothetical protein n=1 Tax=Streptomyces melanogenes TaxID=67326 RepID=UPI0037915DA3